MKALWITWERHRRTREIAPSLHVRLFELVSSAGVPWKYVPLLGRTTFCLARERPTHVFVQCPSLVLGLWSVVLKRLLGYALIADLHNQAVQPCANGPFVYRWMLRCLHRNADLGLVSNNALSPIVEANGGTPFVLPDRIPSLQPASSAAKSGPPYSVVFVCSFAADEPYGEVIEAARLLADLAIVHVTGRHRVEDSPRSVPENVQFTGFLPETAYEELLRHADVVVDLTTREACLVCGAYEAVALEKALVTSDTCALRTYFNRGTVYTQHDPASIAAAIRNALERRTELAREMSLLRRDLEARWEARRLVLLTQLQALATKYHL